MLRAFACFKTRPGPALHHVLSGAAGTLALAEALRVNSSLKTLRLNFQTLYGDRAQGLAELLRVNSTLETPSRETAGGRRFYGLAKNGAIAVDALAVDAKTASETL